MYLAQPNWVVSRSERFHIEHFNRLFIQSFRITMNKTRSGPRKFSEKIALLNRRQSEANAEFEKIMKEVEETTRVVPFYSDGVQYTRMRRRSSNLRGDACEKLVGHLAGPTSVPNRYRSSQPVKYIPQFQLESSPGQPLVNVLPDIRISPIDGDVSQQQATNEGICISSNLAPPSSDTKCSSQRHHLTARSSSSSLSMARSLPDISNLNFLQNLSTSSYAATQAHINGNEAGPVQDCCSSYNLDRSLTSGYTASKCHGNHQPRKLIRVPSLNIDSWPRMDPSDGCDLCYGQRYDYYSSTEEYTNQVQHYDCLACTSSRSTTNGSLCRNGGDFLRTPETNDQRSKIFSSACQLNGYAPSGLDIEDSTKQLQVPQQFHPHQRLVRSHSNIEGNIDLERFYERTRQLEHSAQSFCPTYQSQEYSYEY